MTMRGIYKTISRTVFSLSLVWTLTQIGSPSLYGAPIPAKLTSATAASVSTPLTFPLHVSGNQLTTSTGSPIRLIGVDHSGSEYSCVHGQGFFDGPTDPAAVSAMKKWDINAVRVPLNEDCWLGINGINPTYSGLNYRNAIKGYVHNLNAQGIVAILDLHWNAPGTQLATGQQYMADKSHSIWFWRWVSHEFRTTPGVIFDLYNEPHNISWQCWLSGCVTPGGWQAVGMQQLVDTVRSTGATQPIMLDGNDWAGDLSQWAAYEPVDPLHQLIAGFHVYNFSGCSTSSCWQSVLAPLAQQVPIVTGEVGQNNCSNFTSTYMNWADQQGISYLAWTWNTWGTGCGSQSVISNFNGTPISYGVQMKTHYTDLYQQSLAKP